MGAITSEKHRGPHADDNAHGAICTSPTRADVTSRWQHSSCSARLPGAARRAVQPHHAGLAPLAPPRQSAEEEADPERTPPGLSTHGGAEPGQDAPPPPPAAARGLAARMRLRGDGVRTALPAMPSPIGIGAAGIRTRTPTPHPARPRPVPGPAQAPPWLALAHLAPLLPASGPCTCQAPGWDSHACPRHASPSPRRLCTGHLPPTEVSLPSGHTPPRLAPAASAPSSAPASPGRLPPWPSVVAALRGAPAGCVRRTVSKRRAPVNLAASSRWAGRASVVPQPLHTARRTLEQK